MSMKQELLDRIHRDFTYHPPFGDQAGRYVEIRSLARDLAEMLVRTCPASVELNLALTRLSEVVFWANAAIARNEKAE